MEGHALSVLVRWLHVVAMAVALGGGVLLGLTARAAPPAVALAYERAFWVAAGVLAMTGVGSSSPARSPWSSAPSSGSSFPGSTWSCSASRRACPGPRRTPGRS